MRGARHRATPTGWWQALDEVAAVLLPTRCAGCGRPDHTLCGPCRSTLAGPVRTVAALTGTHPAAWPPDLEGFAVAGYEGPPRRILHAWKDGGRHELTAVVAAALSPVITAVARAVAPADLVIVPVPSPPANLRRRGADLLAQACEQAVRVSVARPGTGPHTLVRALRQPPGVRDQAVLGAADRRRNLAAGLTLIRPVAGRRILLVDDIVTTGASTAAAARTLTAAGAEILAVAAVAATPAPGTSCGGSPVNRVAVG